MSESDTIVTRRLLAVPLPGLRPTSLGNYLATLGLLRVVSRRWSWVRLAWRDGIPCLVGGPVSLDELLDALIRCAGNREWTSYELAWQPKQKEATKAKSGEPIALWRAIADEAMLTKLDSHIVPAAHLYFNPLLGSGGNAGKRKFSDGWGKAVAELHKRLNTVTSDEIAGSKRKKQKLAPDMRAELEAWLTGVRPLTFLLEKVQAASWFSDANKLFNSGQSPAREGQISPWAMALACEGIDLFAGGVSRRLGARTRSSGAFPFVVGPAAPTKAGEAGRDRGEVWAPLWARPATHAETQAIFTRGRAEIGSKGAVTPAAFVTAILHRGVDAGLAAFVRFALGATTSANTFESRWLGEISVPPRQGLQAELPSDKTQTSKREADLFGAGTDVLGSTLNLFDTLPRDKKKGKRWIYKGLRGPIESAMISFAQRPRKAVYARALTDSVVNALDRVGRNRAFRKAGVRWRPFPLDWLSVLLGEDASVEARLGAALVSSFPRDLPFALYYFGIELTPRKEYRIPDQPLPSWVWGGGRLVANLVRVLQRRSLDLSRDGADQHRREVRQGWPAGEADLDAWFAGEIDEDLFVQWLGRFALFDWHRLGARPPALMCNRVSTVVTSTRAIHALLLPLFDRRPVHNQEAGDLLPVESGTRTSAVAQKLAALLSTGHVDDAVDLARVRYSMGNNPLARLDVNFALENPDRFAASLLVPIPDGQRARLIVQRWLRPSRNHGENRHVYT